MVHGGLAVAFRADEHTATVSQAATVGEADLQISLPAEQAPIAAGQEREVVVEVTNAGPDDAVDAVVQASVAGPATVQAALPATCVLAGSSALLPECQEPEPEETCEDRVEILQQRVRKLRRRIRKLRAQTCH